MSIDILASSFNPRVPASGPTQCSRCTDVHQWQHRADHALIMHCTGTEHRRLGDE